MVKRTYDETDVRIRPGRGTRPRTKTRPEHAEAQLAMVVSVDRGRWGCVLKTDPTTRITCMRAREMGRIPVVVGDEVAIVGDLSGKTDTLARIVRVSERRTVLRRTADDTDPYERIVVGNADQLLIVTALADPLPRTGFVERALVAAYVGGLTPILCLTKNDLVDDTFSSAFADLDLQIIHAGQNDDLAATQKLLENKITALIGHSGVGKSTLVNRLVPEAFRATGVVSGVGKGKHTSTQSVALALPKNSTYAGGWVVDTPGIRSFGLAHVTPFDVVSAFTDLADFADECPRGCTHLGPPADPECIFDTLGDQQYRRAMAVRRLLTALTSGMPNEISEATDSENYGLLELDQ